MKCPHCTVEFNPMWNSGSIRPKMAFAGERTDEAWVMGVAIETGWSWQAAECPSCRNDIILLNIHDVSDPEPPLAQYPAYPSAAKRKIVTDRVPVALKDEYEEACQVLPVSPKASAALSRRILQAMLEERGYTADRLVRQIDAVLEETCQDRILPIAIRQKIDAIRNIGNFAAHPITDTTTLEVISVDSEEAEWCLEIIEELFDHYYNTSYQEDSERIARLNENLRRANRPEVRS